MNAIEWALNHTQHTEKRESSTVSVFSGRLNPKMRREVLHAFERLEKYDIGGITRIYNGIKLMVSHDVRSGTTSLIFTKEF